MIPRLHQRGRYRELTGFVTDSIRYFQYLLLGRASQSIDYRGITVLIIGSLILFKGGTLFRINPAPIAFFVVVAVVIIAFVIAKVVGAHRRQASTGSEEMHISVLPKTSLGKWSVGLAIAFILFLVLPFGLIGFELPDPESNLVFAVIVTIIVAGISGAAFVTGLISMIKKSERSVLVFVGMVITFWLGLLGAVGYLFI